MSGQLVGVAGGALLAVLAVYGPPMLWRRVRPRKRRRR